MNTEKIRVLLVDDDTNFVQPLAQSLTGEGFEVQVANDGAAALDALQRGHCDLVITDLNMSEVGGMELLSAIRNNYPKVKTMVITAYPSDESRQRAEELEVEAYLTKPVQLAEVAAIVQRRLKDVPVAESQAS